MTDKLIIRLWEPVQAYQEIKRAWEWAKPLIMAGHRLTAQYGIEEDQRSIQQNRYYWGPCLGAISRQAKLGGTGFNEDGWNWYFKRKFLGYRFKKVMIPGNKRVSVIKELISTKDLSVKKMSVYLEKVQAHAAVDFGVEFADRNWKEFNGHMVDAETGEIYENI